MTPHSMPNATLDNDSPRVLFNKNRKKSLKATQEISSVGKSSGSHPAQSSSLMDNSLRNKLSPSVGNSARGNENVNTHNINIRMKPLAQNFTSSINRDQHPIEVKRVVEDGYHTQQLKPTVHNMHNDNPPQTKSVLPAKILHRDQKESKSKERVKMLTRNNSSQNNRKGSSTTLEELEKREKRKKSHSQASDRAGLKTGDLVKNLKKAKRQFSKNRSHSTSKERSRSHSKLAVLNQT